MSIEEYSKKTEEFERKLIKYKQNIERFLTNKSGVIPGRPAVEQFNSTLFKGMPEESLMVSETSRGANESLPLLAQSNLLQSNVTSTREKNLLNEIDQVMNKIKSKTPVVPAESVKRIMESSEELASRQIKQVVNKRTPPKWKQQPERQAKSRERLNNAGRTVKYTERRATDDEDRPEQTLPVGKSEVRHPSSIPLPPPFKSKSSSEVTRPQMSKQKQALKETIDKYHQLSSQTTIHHSASNVGESEQQLFELSQSIDQRSLISELQHDHEHDIPEQEDSVLVRLYKEKEHLLKEISSIDQQIRQLEGH